MTASVTRNATYRAAGQVKTNVFAQTLNSDVPTRPSSRAAPANTAAAHRHRAVSQTTAATPAARPKTPTTHQPNHNASSFTEGASWGNSGSRVSRFAQSNHGPRGTGC